MGIASLLIYSPLTIARIILVLVSVLSRSFYLKLGKKCGLKLGEKCGKQVTDDRHRSHACVCVVTLIRLSVAMVLLVVLLLSFFGSRWFVGGSPHVHFRFVAVIYSVCSIFSPLFFFWFSS